jgi:hypothetical protein
MDVADWLRVLGLERYETAFRDNGIDTRLLQKLTAEDLKDLGGFRQLSRQRTLFRWSRPGYRRPGQERRNASGGAR